MQALRFERPLIITLHAQHFGDHHGMLEVIRQQRPSERES